MESCPITQNPETKKGKRLVNFIFIKMENFPWPKKRVSIVKDKVKKKKKKKFPTNDKKSCERFLNGQK